MAASGSFWHTTRTCCQRLFFLFLEAPKRHDRFSIDPNARAFRRFFMFYWTSPFLTALFQTRMIQRRESRSSIRNIISKKRTSFLQGSFVRSIPSQSWELARHAEQATTSWQKLQAYRIRIRNRYRSLNYQVTSIAEQTTFLSHFILRGRFVSNHSFSRTVLLEPIRPKASSFSERNLKCWRIKKRGAVNDELLVQKHSMQTTT